MLNFSSFAFISVLCLCLNVCAKEDSKLLFVQILFRHGDRAPITLYPNDPNPESIWSEGLGRLTMLGRRQQYALGKLFRRMYQNFTTSSPLEIEVVSSDSDRCLRSAETNLASFFAPDATWQFDESLDWQPLPVHYIPKNVDKFLEVDSDCPQAFAEQERVRQTPEAQKFLEEHKDMFENLTYYSGTPITEWRSASDFHDVLFIERKYNLTIPSWAEPYWEELRYVSDLSFFWSFNSPLLHRLRAGPLIQKIIEMMNKKISGDLPNQKIQVYSAHDTNIAVVLDALNLFNFKAPPYCSTLIFELHEMSDGINAMRLLFLNSTEPEKEMQPPHVLILNGCTEFCPLSYVINYTKALMPDDWEKECKVKESFIQQVKDQVVIIVLAVIAVVIILLSAWKLCSRNRDKYSYHPMPMS
ncbi:prostatic acid phosphatase-like isoform X2 [Uloborus diversus]|uniref:prostatic acid phosphatase-like isoform X2 n=1 Tax=Uloborus diversus TaxID=327109 RepID=UPI002409C00E|nr:prostatic acid phosphatase-like isoform X2 [Uloborus diversus]